MIPVDRNFGRATTFILGVSYPAMVFIGITYGGPAAVGILSLIAGGLRLALSGTRDRAPRWRPDELGVLLVCIGLVTLMSDALVAARLYPLVVNLAALGYFTWTLVQPPSAVERIARLRDPELPHSAIAYTRRVTIIWCGFFVGNGAIAGYTAFWSSLETWTLYNGFISYLLMGSLLAGEYFVRLQVQRARIAHD